MNGIVRINSNFHSTTILVLNISNKVVLVGRVESKIVKEDLQDKSYKLGVDIANKMNLMELSTVDAIVRGPGIGKEAILTSLMDCGINIRLIKDVTPIPHNGIVQSKRMRLMKNSSRYSNH